MRPESVRIVLVDDEPLVRRGLRDSLASVSGVEVVGEAGDGFAAIERIEGLRPDLVFLDVQMPGCDGFEVLAQLECEPRPAVVFVTAYEQYALRAFDAHAVDYLLKPFDDARFHAALGHALAWLARGVAGGDDKVPALLAEVGATRRRERFVVKQAGRLRLVRATEVDWIEARGNYVHLHHADGPFLVRETLASLQATLDPERFVRTHRSAIVALPQVATMERLPSGDFELCLHSGARVGLSRSHRAAFERAWRGGAP
ncbi:MAG TPA: LytTR family DNA-binding domain-containing protein [Planctomycetota bacterium]|nr:LytTR family DNA-binding domain-containing protein [Planctomycetota bacterium]